LYINENFFLNKKINNIFFKKKCKKLIGLKYCLISNRKLKKIKPIKPNIFLFFGGSDEKNLTIKILKKLRYNKNCYFHIVVNNIVLINKIKKLNLINIKIYPQKNNFYRILRKCNYALISGGSTIWDIIYNQIPLIAIPTAKNQIRNLNNLKKKKIIFLYKKKIDKNFVKYFNIFVSDSIRPSNLIDGLGLKRVVKEINKI
jgi:spore coat polysaccharide biosynthesis predicted glycosyltransferase SpsG